MAPTLFSTTMPYPRRNFLRTAKTIINGKISPGNVVKITTFEKEINAEIKEIYDRKNA